MSRSPAITSLLNGHAVNCGLASTSVTSRRGSARRRNRAAVAPPNPPPTTTTRADAWARATKGASRRDDADARKLRRDTVAPSPQPPPPQRGGGAVALLSRLPPPLREGVGGRGCPGLLVISGPQPTPRSPRSRR